MHSKILSLNTTPRDCPPLPPYPLLFPPPPSPFSSPVLPPTHCCRAPSAPALAPQPPLHSNQILSPSSSLAPSSNRPPSSRCDRRPTVPGATAPERTTPGSAPDAHWSRWMGSFSDPNYRPPPLWTRLTRIGAVIGCEACRTPLCGRRSHDRFYDDAGEATAGPVGPTSLTARPARAVGPVRVTSDRGPPFPFGHHPVPTFCRSRTRGLTVALEQLSPYICRSVSAFGERFAAMSRLR
ncbi:hypothetical protein MPTK1_2g17530 [Marchantia polymorpha subsp. ruderalis]|uniref:Uncharacterized protein n=1 Tax=Marchantia polymorpha TaxID=3197 RepID=A0A2R6WG74_MARPO|nr:hypothetical protein MARPO_0094s0021 [Marchantia polymorpha]BBN02720.1 hypothetical protein Mp_2g17530 [Marchantia polymorpha subsp. ruderalis]|eukprot:PTQ32844.1 hypothetical protein MARPO_0094s0021 [Marchantia polymorpha]